MIPETSSKRVSAGDRRTRSCPPGLAWVFAVILFLFCVVPTGQAQSSWAPIAVTPPPQDAVDENFVSVLTGKVHFSLPMLKLGDVAFAPYTTNEKFSKIIGGNQGGTADSNYGHIVLCYNPNGVTSYSVTTECVSVVATLQAIYGEQRSSFQYQSGQYTSVLFDGSTFTDNGTTCTWTQRDGTQIVYAAFHISGNPVCQSHNISKIVHPDGHIQTYYYYGSFSTAVDYTPSPIISIATNSGYLLKYIYPSTPTWGGESSVVAINRAFETCDPTAVACTLTNTWPTSTLTWVDKPVSPADGYLPSTVSGYNLHYTFTLTDAAHRQHVFELDSLFRVISYQPPEATTPVYTYNLCSLHADGQGTVASPDTMTHCFGYTQWANDPHNPNTPFLPLLWDLVETSTRNGQNWQYVSSFSFGSLPGWSEWHHTIAHPLGTAMSASGNSTPGAEQSFGPTDSISHFDGTVDHFDRSLQNLIINRQTPAGILRVYGFDSPRNVTANLRANLWNIQTNPVSGSGLTAVSQSATYPTSCSNIITCNKPLTVTDANGNTATFTYDPTHGGVTTMTAPAVSAAQPQVSAPPASTVQPQTRYTYALSYAWYLSSSGVMTRETNGIYLPKTESYCLSGPAAAPPANPGSGCTVANDEVLTTYDYGPDSGPNNLILRGKAVSWKGQTLRTCYGHDKQGNKIWESSANATPASCPAY